MATEEKLVSRTRITLREAKSYTHPSCGKFIKDVPRVIVGSKADEFKVNGNFRCVVLEPKLKKVKKSKKIKKSSDGSKKKVLKKSSSKKTTKKKAAKKA